MSSVSAGPRISFLKGHGTGNDFVLLPDPEGRIQLTPELVVGLCSRRFGIGADGVLRIVRSEHVPGGVAAGEGQARWFMDYHNADGSLAEMCGNGVRVYARFLVAAGWEPAGELLLDTRGGTKRVWVPEDGDVTVDMGAPGRGAPAEKVAVNGRSYEGVPVSMGNPHLVVRLDDPAEVAALDLTAEPEFSAEAFPTGVNVEFYAVSGEPGHPLVMRVHERGSGETLSCGTGACAVAVAAAGEPGSNVLVDVPGGRLTVQWTPETVLLRGPAELVAEGEWLLGDGSVPECAPTPAELG